MHEIWETAKGGDLHVLGEEEKRIAQVMLEHEDEYFNQFEMADALSDYEFDPDSEENPFLHITLHATVENQLEARDPIEAYQFYNSMRKRKVSRHDTIHLIAMMLAPIIVTSLQRGNAPDMGMYKALLKKYKGKKPEKIYDALERDLSPLFEGP
jgi:hypothetical protein